MEPKLENLDKEKLKKRVARAHKAVGLRVAYKLGKGGFFPWDDKPTRNGQCDCSGFVAWVLGVSRVPKLTRLWWIETTRIHSDATKKQKVFVQIPKPVPGCLVVYPDYVLDGKHKEGHVAIVSDVNPIGGIEIIDCSIGNYKATGEAIYKRDGAFFLRNKKTIFCVLKEDFLVQA